MSVIKVTNLSKEFSYYRKNAGLKGSLTNLFHREKLNKEAVRDISFEIGEGEIVGFLGPNGAGKTTTLKMLSGILHPTSGIASVLGYTPWERKKEFKMQFSIVMGQKSQLWWDLPAIESLDLNRYIYEINMKDYKATIEELAELLDVKDLLNIQVRRLSLGERMKMELIAALMHKPRVLFLDEPTIGLDIISQKKVREFLKYYNEEKKTTILLTSHYMKDIEDLCKRSVIINQGKIVFDSDISKVSDVLGQKKIVKLELAEYVDKAVISKLGEVKKFDGLNVVIEANKKDIREISRVILDSMPFVDFNIEDIPIEDGIELLYKRGEV